MEVQLCLAVVRDKEPNPLGVRFKGTKIPWKVVTPSAEKGKPPNAEWKEHWRTKVQEECDLFIIDLYMEAMHALHTSYEYDVLPTDSEADQMRSRKEALETEFLAIEQTAVAKLKKLNWDDDGVKYTCEFLYFTSYHPFVDGETPKNELINYHEMVVTKVVHALTFKYV